MFHALTIIFKMFLGYQVLIQTYAGLCACEYTHAYTLTAECQEL